MPFDERSAFTRFTANLVFFVLLFLEYRRTTYNKTVGGSPCILPYFISPLPLHSGVPYPYIYPHQEVDVVQYLVEMEVASQVNIRRAQ